jgi:hypothetical protein
MSDPIQSDKAPSVAAAAKSIRENETDLARAGAQNSTEAKDSL